MKNILLSFNFLHPYLPSPPHAPLGVTDTSLQVSVCVLYTSSFRGFPSWASISEKKSSDCEEWLFFTESLTCANFNYLFTYFQVIHGLWETRVQKKWWFLHLAAPDLPQRCSHCRAEDLPALQESWLPHPWGRSLSQNTKSTQIHPLFKLIKEDISEHIKKSS